MSILKGVLDFVKRTPRIEEREDRKDIHLPKEIEQITALVGYEAALTIWKHYAGRTVFFPTLAAFDNARRSDRDREIMKRYNEGEKPKKLADEYGITERRLWQIIKQKNS